MIKWRASLFFKAVSFLILTVFIHQQILFAQDLHIEVNGQIAPVRALEDAVGKTASEEKPFYVNDTSFLSGKHYSPLSTANSPDKPASGDGSVKPEINPPKDQSGSEARGTEGVSSGEVASDPESLLQQIKESIERSAEETEVNSARSYELERYDFDDAIDFLRPEYAAAVILTSISEEDIKTLTTLPFETAVIVLSGEIVLFSTGNEKEIRILTPVQALLKEASFTTHVHVEDHFQSGPSQFDLENAVQAPYAEYVITAGGVYAYSASGILNADEPYSYNEFTSILGNALARDRRSGQDQVEARQKLNSFIHQMDLLNEELRTDYDRFRMGAVQPPTVNAVPPFTNQSRFLLSGTKPANTAIWINGAQALPLDSLIKWSYAATLSEEKTYSFSIMAKDSAGNESDPVVVRTTYDRTVPTSAITLPTSGATVSYRGFRMEGSASDASEVSALEVIVRGAAGTFYDSAVYDPATANWYYNVSQSQLTANSSLTLLSRAKDQAGNYSTWQSIRVMTDFDEEADVTAPVMTITTEAATSTGFVFGGTISDDKSGVSEVRVYVYDYYRRAYTVSNQLAQYDAGTGTWAFQVLPSHVTSGYRTRLLVRAKDQSNNWTPFQYREYIVDSDPNIDIEPPVLAITSPQSEATVSADGFRFQGTIYDLKAQVAEVRVYVYDYARALYTVSNEIAVYDAVTGEWSFNVEVSDVTHGNRARLYVRGKDTNNLWSSWFSVVVNVRDTTPPVGSILINAGAEYATSYDLTLDLSATDTATGVESMRFSLDEGLNWTEWEAYSSSKSITLTPGEGMRQISAQFRDRAGNITLASDIVTLDTVAPSGSILINNGADFTRSSALTLTLSGQDATSGVTDMQFSVDGGVTWTAWEAFAGTKSLSVSSGDGLKEVRYQLKDRAGLVSPIYSDMITLDTTPPTLTVTSPLPFATVSEQGFTIQGTVSDVHAQVSTVRLYVYDYGRSTYTVINQPAAYNSATGTWSFQVLPSHITEGKQAIFFVRAEDTIGNRTGWRSARVTIRDVTPPQGSILINSGELFTRLTDVTLHLTATDAGSGINKMSFSSDGSNWTPQEPFSTTKIYTLPSSDGLKTVYVKYYDRQGNVSSVYSASITLDATPPSGSIAINGGAAQTSSRDVVLTLTGDDATSGIDGMQFSVDGGVNWTASEPFSTPMPITLPEGGGEKQVIFQLRDRAANLSTFTDSILVVIGETVIEFLSPDTTSDPLYTLIYTVNSEQRQEEWRLNPGFNLLKVHASSNGSTPGFAEFSVTLNQTEDPVPDMPAKPVPPEDLVSLTTENGLVIKYLNGSIFSVEKPDEYELFLPEFGTDGGLTGGLLEFSSGARLLYKDGIPIYQISSDGEKTFYYEDGSVRAVESTTGNRVRFAYRYGGTGTISSILSMEETVSSLYGTGNVPVWVEIPDGTDIRYEDGLLNQFLDSAGNLFHYDIAEIRNDPTLEGYLSKLASVTVSGNAFPTLITEILASPSIYPTVISTLEEKLAEEIHYDVNKATTQFVSGKGEVLTLTNRLPNSLQNSLGELFSITAELNERGDLASIHWEESGLIQMFDEEGNLSGLRLSDGTVFQVESRTVDEIVLSDESVLSGLIWNGNDLTQFLRKSPDGSEEKYENSALVYRIDASGNKVSYVYFGGSAHPDKITTDDGRVYQFIEYENSSGGTDRLAELTTVNLPDGSRIDFEHGKPVRYVKTKEIELDPLEVPVLPSGQSFVPLIEFPQAKLRAMTIDENANILSGEILFNDGTQYIIQNGEVIKQITPFGQFIEFEEDLNPPDVPVAIPPEPLTQPEEAYRRELIETQLDFFSNNIGIHELTGLPLDNYRGDTGEQSNYSQATLVGFWAEILSSIARDPSITTRMTQVEAFQKLDLMLQSFRQAQQEAGYYGFVSFFTITVEEEPVIGPDGLPTGEVIRVPRYSRTFDSVGSGDNLNLLVSLSAVLGALEGISFSPEASLYRDRILQTINSIIGGFVIQFGRFYDPVTNRMRMAYIPSTGQFVGHMDRVFNEFRTGMFLLASLAGFYAPAVRNLDVTVRSYTTSGGRTFEQAVPFDGGAFQMFWPLIHVDETQFPEFDAALKNFLYAQAEFVKANGTPGLLSAGDYPGSGYQGKIGLPTASETDDPLFTDVGSIYGLASAFPLAPHYALQFLKNLESRFPQMRTNAGFVDAIRFGGTGEPIFSSQYFGVDQASFILSLLGTSRSYFSRYLERHGYKAEFEQWYKSMTLGLDPIDSDIPSAPDLAGNTPILYDGTSVSPDGRAAGLVKKQGLVPAIFDPEFGEGKIFNYFSVDGILRKTEIEFGESTSLRRMDLQEYILLPGRAQVARSLSDGFVLDLLNAARAQGAFYTPDEGYANIAITSDALLGEVRHMEYDLRALNRPVGGWALYDRVDLSPFDFLSVPVRLGSDTQEGVRLKFEFKGMGQIFVSPPLTHEWQYVHIPIVKPVGQLTEIAMVIQSITGGPVTGDLFIGPLSLFKSRTSTQLDWMAMLGKTDAEIRTLLKQQVLSQAGGGGFVETDEVLEDFKVDSEGNLIEGVFKRADGSIQYFQNGHLNKWVFPNGRTILFEEGLAAFAIDLARGKLEEARFYYDKSFQGEIRSSVIQDNDRKRVFDREGRITSMVEDGNILQFLDGRIFSIETPLAFLTNLEFAIDRSLLRAHVTMKDGREFDIDQTVEQVLDLGNGVLIYYRGSEITAIETLQNGRTDFTYIYNAASQLIGVNATFVDIDTITRTLPLAEYILRPERSLEKEQILREAPVDIIDRSLIGGFSVGQLPSGEYTHGIKGNRGYDSKAWYGFRYQSATGTILGMVADHRSLPVLISNYGFLALTIMQDPTMDWNQDFNLKLKTPSRQTIYAFEVDNTQNQYQTFVFPLAGKSGSEGEITLEVVREGEGVGDLGQVYIKDLSYIAVNTLDRPLWEDQIQITSSLIQSLAIEAANLTSVSGEMASGRSLKFDSLASLFDVATRMLYTETVPGESQLVSFKRFDGSEVELEGQSVRQITLPDGTINEYDAGQNAGSGTIQGPGGDLSDSGALEYRYGALRQIIQPDGRQFSLSYSFDENGEEITTLRDELLGEERRFKGGKLIDGLSRDNLESRYSYENGKLIGAELLYKNRVLDSTRFLFSGDETQVTDERGTTWFYDAKGNLTKHLTQDGFLYRYNKETIRLEGDAPGTADYKNAIFNATDLLGIHLLGYQSPDDSQILYDFEEEGRGDIRLNSGDHGVNIAFDKEQRIKSGQVQFADGMIVEIENYTPVRGRLADGTFFEILLPAAERYEILQSENGGYLGFRLTINGIFYTYDTVGRLTKVESGEGKKDEFTYTAGTNGSVTQYTHRTITPVSFNGVPFPKEVDLISDGNLRFLDSGNEITRREGSGFLVAVYNEALDIWDTYSGSFSSGGDRLGLTQFLNQIRPGSYIAAIVSDTSFSSADEAILSRFESLGAGQIRQASAGNQRWGFMGNESLNSGEGYEVLGADSVSSVMRSQSIVDVGAGTGLLFNGVAMVLYLPEPVSTAYSRFLENYEHVRPPDDTQKLTVHNAQNEIVFTKRLDGVSAYYEFGNVRETFDEAGGLLSVHEYDCPGGVCENSDDMKLKRITLVKARSDFETESARLREQIEQTKFDALYRLAWQDEAARLRIKETVDSALSEIDSQVASLESQRYVGVEFCKQGFFRRKCQTLPVEVPGVAEAIQTLLNQRADLLKTAEEQLALIPGEVAAKKQEIEQATLERMTELETQEKEFILDVLRSEMEPIITDRYRRILGRDASREELDNWIARYRTTQEIDTAVLESELQSSSEKTLRETQKVQIIQEVRTFLENYLVASLEQRAALLLGLKLNAGEVVDLTTEDVEEILTWLESRDLHFGQSAFLSLKEMLTSKGVVVSMEDLGYRAILIDILAGVMNRFNEGDLLLSAFALTRTAAIYGQNFSTVKYSFDDLLGFYLSRCPDPNAPCALRMIARIGEDHFVVIVRVTSDEVVYREVVKGPQGEDITVSREKFVETWQDKNADAGGYLIVSEEELISAKQLTDVEAMQVKGAFLPFLFAFLFTYVIKPLIAFVIKFFSAVLGKLVGFTSIVNTIIGTVANLASWIVEGVKLAFTQIAQSGFFESIRQGFAVIGKALLTPIKFAGRFIQKGFVFLKEAFSTGLERLGTGIMRIKDFLLTGAGEAIRDPITGQIIGHEFTFAQTVARNIVAAGLNYGATKGLESFGLPPSIARIGGAFVGSGFFGIGAQASSFFKSGLQGFLLQGVSEIGLKLNLPPPFTDGLSLLAGSALNAYFDPTLTLRQSVTLIAPQVSQKLTLGGMDLLGRSLGWDARISRLLGLPFSAAVGGILQDVTQPGTGPGNIWNAITSSLIAESVHFGTQVVFDELNLSPMLNHFGLSLFSSISQGLFNSTWNTSGNRASEESIFSRISGNIAQFGRALAQGVGQVISFGTKVLEGGVGLVRDSFARAINFFSGIFSRDSQEILLQAGNGSIEGAILNSAVINGNSATAVVGNTQIHWDGDLNQLAIQEGNRTKTFFDVAIDTVGQFFSSRVAYAEEIEEGIFLNQSFQGNKLTDLSITGLGNTLFKAIASGPLGLVFDAAGNILNGIFEIPQIFKIGVKEGEIDFVETEGKEGIFQTLISEATELLSFGAGYVYNAVQKVTLTLFDIVKNVLSPIGTALDNFYGKIIGRNEKDLKTLSDVASETGFSALNLSLDQIRALPGGLMPDGSGWAFVGEDFDNYRDLLPPEVRAKLDLQDETARKIRDYYRSQEVWFFGNTATIKVQYQERFNDASVTPFQEFAKKWILGWGFHDTLKRSWFGGNSPDTNPQMLIDGQPSDGLAQQRLIDGHITDLYIHGARGHFAIHGKKEEEASNVFLSGILGHIFLELPKWVFKKISGQGA